MGDCNVDDILCKIEALRSMRALQAALGKESFSAEFPELEGVDEKLSRSITTSQGDLKSALAKCGNVDLAGLEEEGLEEYDGDAEGE